MGAHGNEQLSGIEAAIRDWRHGVLSHEEALNRIRELASTPDGGPAFEEEIFDKGLG